MKKLLFLSACLWALAATPVRAQAKPADIVVVRIRIDEWAVVTRGDGKSETIYLLSGKNKDTLTDSSEGYYKLITKLSQEGYVLQNSFVTGQFGAFTTLIFAKPQP